MLKKILIFIDWFTPAYKAGGPVQSVANLVSQLRSEFDFFILTSDRDLNDSSPFDNIPLNCWIERNGIHIMYLSPEHQDLKQYRKILNDQFFDALYFNGIFSVPFTLKPLLIARSKVKRIIIAPRGMLGSGALKIKFLKKKVFILLANLLGLFKNICWHATADTERLEIRKHFGSKTNIVLAPNMSSLGLLKNPAREKNRDNLRLFFLGRISRKKNLLYALSILNSVSADISIHFSIIGPIDDKIYWEQCQAAIFSLPEHIHTDYLGPIQNQELPNYLRTFHFFFFPTLHENFGHAIIESLQCGCPVIISNCTPWRKLEKIHSPAPDKQDLNAGMGIGWDIPLENPERFLKVIEQCGHLDQENFNQLSNNAFNYALTVVRDTSILDANRKLFE